MAEILGLLKISQEQAIGAPTLAVDPDHGLEEGLGVGVAEAAAVDPDHGLEEGLGVGVAEAAAVDLEVSQKVAPGK